MENNCFCVPKEGDGNIYNQICAVFWAPVFGLFLKIQIV
jgi:hypothetical protein